MVRVIKVNEMQDLASKKFKSFMEKDFGKRAFVLVVTAEWCGHCRVFKPEIDKAIANIKKKKLPGTASQRGGDSGILLQMSDTTSSHVMQNHGGSLLGKMLNEQVGGFPTALAVGGITSNNTMHIKHFNQERSAANFQKFMLQTASLQ